MGKEVLSLIEKNARNTSIVKSDYDKNVEKYDRVRFETAQEGNTSTIRNKNSWPP